MQPAFEKEITIRGNQKQETKSLIFFEKKLDNKLKSLTFASPFRNRRETKQEISAERRLDIKFFEVMK